MIIIKNHIYMYTSKLVLQNEFAASNHLLWILKTHAAAAGNELIFTQGVLYLVPYRF